MSIIDFNKLMINKAGKLVSFDKHLKVCVPIAPELNGLPNIFLDEVISETDTSVNQTFKVKDNTKDYDGIKVVLNTALDDVLFTLKKNSTGEYNLELPILEKGKIITYYIYAYKDDKIGNYTVKRVYEKDDEPTPPEPEDPIEEYQITGLQVDKGYYTSDDIVASSISWNPCQESWFDEQCVYVLTVNHNGENIYSVNIDYNSDTSYNLYESDIDFIDSENYSVEILIDKNGVRSLPQVTEFTYQDPIHDINVYISNTDLYINNENEDGYNLSWDIDTFNYSDVVSKCEIYLDGELYAEKDYENQTIIEDKDPGTYSLEIKLYNSKGVSISTTDQLTLNDPIYSVTLYTPDISYIDTDDTIDISNIYATYGENNDGLPNYLVNRLESLAIYIDDNEFKTIPYDPYSTNVIVDVSELSSGNHTLSIGLVTTYGEESKSDETEFEIQRCSLIGNNIKITSATLTSDGDVILNWKLGNSINELVVNCELVNNNNGWSTSLGIDEINLGKITISKSDLALGVVNEFNISITCDHGEQLTSSTSIYVPDFDSYITISSIEYNLGDSASPNATIYYEITSQATDWKVTYNGEIGDADPLVNDEMVSSFTITNLESGVHEFTLTATTKDMSIEVSDELNIPVPIDSLSIDIIDNTSSSFPHQASINCEFYNDDNKIHEDYTIEFMGESRTLYWNNGDEYKIDTFEIDNLEPGSYTETLTVTDSKGNLKTEDITFEVYDWPEDNY